MTRSLAREPSTVPVIRCWSINVYARNLTGTDYIIPTFARSPAAFGVQAVFWRAALGGASASRGVAARSRAW